jgi:hypothetical protein
VLSNEEEDGHDTCMDVVTLEQGHEDGIHRDVYVPHGERRMGRKG